MDSERSRTIKAAERPATRWQRNWHDTRDSEGTSDRPQTSVSRLKSKIERPTSRRGLKNDIQDYNIVSSSYQAGLPGRNSSANSELNYAIKLIPQNTGLCANSFARNASGIDRPVTQQGIALVRPSSTRGLPRMSRQIQDKRYYAGLVQLKIRELSQEMVTIMREIDAHNKERLALMHYDQQAKALAAELIDLQGQLADFNIVVDKMTSDPGKSTIEQESCELIQSNDLVLSEIEIMFEKRHLQERQCRDTENDVISKRKSAKRIVENMDAHIREKYGKLYSQKTKLQEKIDELQRDSDYLSREKMSLEERAALSQVKQEAVRMQIKIIEIEEQRHKLREEEKNKFSPREEKDHLLQRVKQDNIDIAASERRILEMQKRIVEVEQEIEELEVDLDEDWSGKHVKFKEICKREDAMEVFIGTFDENKFEELEKLKKLKAVVIDRLETISSEIDGEVQLSDNQDLVFFNFHLKENPKTYQDFEDLRRDNIRLLKMIMKMENLEKRFKTELKDLEEKIEKYQSVLIILEDLDGLKMQFKTKHGDLLVQLLNLKIQQPACQQELENVQKDYNEIKSDLDKNETYLQVNALETKLKNLQQINLTKQNSIIKYNERMNYCYVKERTLSLVARYNVVLTQSF